MLVLTFEHDNARILLLDFGCPKDLGRFVTRVSEALDLDRMLSLADAVYERSDERFYYFRLTRKSHAALHEYVDTPGLWGVEIHDNETGTEFVDHIVDCVFRYGSKWEQNKTIHPDEYRKQWKKCV